MRGKIIVVLSMLPILWGGVEGIHKEMPELSRRGKQIRPTGVMLSWIGAGQLTDVTLSNTGQGGIYWRPPDWEYYDGTWPTGYGYFGPGRAGEYPPGSEQFYMWSNGLWVGAMFPRVIGGDTFPEPRVAQMAYYSDLSAMSPLYQSNQRIPEGEDGEGDFLFALPRTEPGEYQRRWSFPFPHDTTITFVDTTINQRRRAFFETDEYDLIPDSGDVVSTEDTWAVMGDWIPEEEGRFIWARGYDTEPLGLRIIQRTYSWNYGYADDYIIFSYKIKNMNDFPLDSVYIGYFMDNDIGGGALDDDEGSNDDLIGFDVGLNLGYTYDVNNYEPGWVTATGYIGCIFLETLRDEHGEEIGLTGFQTWDREGPEGEVDNDERDDRKYAQLVGFNIPDDSDTIDPFEVSDTAVDQRQLMSSGPYARLEPGQEVSFTVAVIAGHSLADLKDNARMARLHFEMGFMGATPPPVPVVTVTPSDGRVYIAWDKASMKTTDLMTGEQDFAGYRVYKSETGIAGDWQLLADYDIKGDTLGRAVITKYRRGGSTLNYGFSRFWDPCEHDFVGHSYAIEFVSDTTFTVYNSSRREGYRYNTEALDELGRGFCVVGGVDDPLDNVLPPPDPDNLFIGRYIPGDTLFLYLDGFFIYLAEGTFDPDLPPDTRYHPQAGDLFVIETVMAEAVGADANVFHFYVDEDVINGMTYYYAVTAYDRGSREPEIESLESGKVRHRVVPRTEPVDWQFPERPEIERTGGTGDIRFEAYIAKPDEVLDAEYIIRFGTDSPGTDSADFWQLVRVKNDTLEDTLIVRSEEINFEGTPIIDGLSFQLATVLRPTIDRETVIDEGKTGWIEGASNFDFTFSPVSALAVEPRQSYHIVFSDTGSYDFRGRKAPFEIWNIDLGEPVTFFYLGGCSTNIYPDEHGFAIAILIVVSEVPRVTIRLDALQTDSAFIHPEIGDIYHVKLLIRCTIEDEYRVRTTSRTEKAVYSLDNIRVVPNPYFMREAWDKDAFNVWIMFQNLPSKCKIRIFNTAGLPIRTIEHDGGTEMGGSAKWNLMTDEGMQAVSGLYIYQVVTEDGREAIGKFAIIR